MKAAFLDPENRPFVREIEEPQAGPGEVVVAVHASALHHGNLLGTGERALGSEAVGVVARAGAGTEFAPGQRVGVFPAWGAVRERIALPAEHVFALPTDLADERAAQLFVNPLTALMIAREVGRVITGTGPGPVVVSAAASAVGRVLTRLELREGHEVVAVTRRPASAQAIAAELGVPAVATQEPDWPAALTRALGGRAPVVVADGHGGSDGRVLRSLLADRGALVVYGDLSGEPVPFATGELLGRSHSIRGVSVIRWTAEESRPERAADIAAVQRLVAEHPELLAVADTHGLGELGTAIDRVRAARGDGVVVVRLT